MEGTAEARDFSSRGMLKHVILKKGVQLGFISLDQDFANNLRSVFNHLVALSLPFFVSEVEICPVTLGFQLA
jgi:hypothetical protein